MNIKIEKIRSDAGLIDKSPEKKYNFIYWTGLTKLFGLFCCSISFHMKLTESNQPQYDMVCLRGRPVPKANLLYAEQ